MRKDQTFADDLLEAAGDEQIEAVLVAPWDYGREHSDPPRGRLLPWSEAEEYLRYDYDRGFGGANCHAVFCWTKSWLIFVSTYDGSTEVERMPRDPSLAVVPYMPGGG